MAGTAPHTWAFWFQWVGAGSVGGALLALGARPLSMTLGGFAGRTAGPLVGEAVVGFVAGGLVLAGIGFAQSLVLRPHAPWAWSWLVACALSGAFGGASMLALFQALGGMGGVVTGVVGGLGLIAALQWVVLQPQLSWATWLAVGSAAGLAAAGPATALLGPLGFGAVQSAVTGGVIIWHLRDVAGASG